MSQNRKQTNTILTPKMVAVGFVLTAALIAELFFDTWCAVQCRRTGYEIVQAESRRDDLKETRKKLQIERVRLQSPEVLGSLAKESLGLTTPKPEQVVIVK